MSEKGEAVGGSSRKRISPPEQKKKRRVDSHVKLNQTGFSYAEMQREYRTPGRKKRKTPLLNAKFVEEAFAFARDNDSNFVPESCIRSNEVTERDRDLTRSYHNCLISTPAGHGAVTIHSVFHYDEGKWSKEADSRLCAAIVAHADNGPFGSISWKKVAAEMGPHYCNVQCKARWQNVKEMYECREDEKASCG